METYDLLVIKIYNSKMDLFTIKTISDILSVKNEATLLNIIRKFIKIGIIAKLERGRYILKDSNINDFTLANFIYSQSYISFETALNYYGILSQFPYVISSATSKKTKEKIIGDKTFRYFHIKKELFWGYEKKNDFIIAFPEKAVLDQLYLSSKGLLSINLDEYDFTGIIWQKIVDFSKRYPKTRQFIKGMKNLRGYIKKW